MSDVIWQRLWSLAPCLCAQAVLCLLSLSAAGAEPPKRVLVLYENSRLLPANIEGDRGFNAVVETSSVPADVRAEFLDYPNFSGDNYAETVSTFLHEKYRNAEPDIIVAGGGGALEFVLENRQKLFPQAAIVYMGVPKSLLDGRRIPPNVYGIPVEFDPIGTIEQALRWHPRATRLVVVSGDSEEEQTMLAGLRRDLPRLGDRLKHTEYLTGLSTEDLRKRVASLPSDTIIFTPGYYKDATGRSFTPRQAAAAIAQAASVPVYGPYNTFIGTGVVGGRVPTFSAMGETAGGIVKNLLDGTSISGLPAVMPTQLSVDWRQVERWGIDEAAIPAGTLVQYRSPSFWDEYRTAALIALGIVLVQSALLTWLLLERRRRRKAETAVTKHRFELAHASRLAVAGELTAAIAHEINQPLGAIQNNVAAALLLLRGDAPRDDLDQILGDIGRDNVRASSVIKQLRGLLEKHEVEHQLIDLNGALEDMMTVLRAEAQRRRLKLTIRPSADAVAVVGDRVQVLQILINLVLNAMDAVAGESEERRLVTVAATIEDGAARLDVTDTGHGIDPANEAKLFDSFFSTKANGIGLGLAIVRTLAEAHGGKVEAQNRPSGGAMFRVTFPLASTPARREVA